MSSSGLYKKSDQKSVEWFNVSVRRLSSLLGLATLACLFIFLAPWKNSSEGLSPSKVR